jgi:hypothetical protein
MRTRAISCLATLLALSACESSPVTPPATDAATAIPTTTTIAWRGDGTQESPYYYAEPDEWTTSYSFQETQTLYEWDAAPCPPMYRGILWIWINIANVGRRRFYFQPPFYWARTIAPGYAVYDVVVPGVDERGEWTASGPVVAECRRGLLPGLGLIRLTDHLGQLRRNGINAGGDDGCGGGGGGYDDPVYITSYDPYAPAPADTGEATIECGGGGGGGGRTCYWEWMDIEISRDGGGSWEPWWSGWGQVCYENEE